MATKSGRPITQKLVGFFFTSVGMTILLAIGAVAASLLVNAFHHGFIASEILWFQEAERGEDSSSTLIAIGSIAVVVWTGAIIAFQLRGTSSQLSGAFSLLEYGFIAPLVALLIQGVELRALAFLAALTFAAMALRHVLIFFPMKWLLKRTAEGDSDREFLASVIGQRVLKAIVGTTIFPIGYAGACAAATLAVAVMATQYAVAVTSLGTLCFGLYYILGTLKNDKTATPQQQAANRKALADMIGMFERRAAALKQTAPPVESPASTSESSAAASHGTDPNALTTAQRQTLVTELEDVAAFLSPLRYQELRPGLLTREQILKARRVLRYAMEKASNDKEAFDLAMGLNALLATVDPSDEDSSP